jgi:hypothetical protein
MVDEEKQRNAVGKGALPVNGACTNDDDDREVNDDEMMSSGNEWC